MKIRKNVLFSCLNPMIYLDSIFLLWVQTTTQRIGSFSFCHLNEEEKSEFISGALRLCRKWHIERRAWKKVVIRKYWLFDICWLRMWAKKQQTPMKSHNSEYSVIWFSCVFAFELTSGDWIVCWMIFLLIFLLIFVTWHREMAKHLRF